MPISLSNQKESYQEWRLTGEFDIPMQDVSTQTGDVVTFVALVADNYGRKASSVLSRYKILEGKELEYLAYDMLDLTGQTLERRCGSEAVSAQLSCSLCSFSCLPSVS